MDTKPLELETEFFVQHHLIKHGFKVTKPNFDSDGADLLIIDNLNTKFTKIIKVQCKGRTVKPSTEVKLAKSYVTENFLLFLYIKTSDSDNALYFFTPEEICLWGGRGDYFILNITEKNLQDNKFKSNEFSKESPSKIKEILRKSEIKKYSSLIIEEHFIQKAIDKTISIYEELYPGRSFDRPTVNKAIHGILSTYDNFCTPGLPVKCYVFAEMDTENHSKNIESSRIYTDHGIEVKIYRETADNEVHTEILEHLNRTINTENIMLAIDDYIYEEPLNLLANKGVNVRLIQFSSSDGRQIYTSHMWGDIVYSIAHALGLSRLEW